MPSVLALDPGTHLGYALVGREFAVGVLTLSEDYRSAVREAVAKLRPLLLKADRVYVEEWGYQGRRLGKEQMIPLALTGAFLALGAEPVPALWKRRMIQGVVLGHTAERLGVKFPSGLDRKDRALWFRLHLEGYGPALARVRQLPRRLRPHALDAFGLAIYARTVAKIEGEGVMPG
ncbi:MULTISPECIES: hypothetical protein [Thermus]|uniref:Holliday junction resolvase RuvC n=1 Tax=Thermus tengchongensis TaxID=1214928 RepID=A0A7V4E6E3_9DEIN|nr:hypothetical protein [Thermus brockianus]